MSVPQAACLAIAVLLIEFPVSNGFTLMRNTGCNREGGEKNACHPRADERSAGTSVILQLRRPFRHPSFSELFDSFATFVQRDTNAI